MEIMAADRFKQPLGNIAFERGLLAGATPFRGMPLTFRIPETKANRLVPMMFPPISPWLSSSTAETTTSGIHHGLLPKVRAYIVLPFLPIL